MSVEPGSEQNESADLHIGKDEWVARAERLRERRGGMLSALADRWATLPQPLRIALITIPLVLMPFVTRADFFLEAFKIGNNDFIVRIGGDFLAYAILAVGLNVVVGYAGLLDLGYIAFWGIAGYAYAYLSSDFIGDGVHVPALISIPLIVMFTALVGWGLGSASLRLRGDYLAIVTLGFGQLFVQLMTTLTRVELPGLARPVDLTRGPNGINNLDEISLFGLQLKTNQDYYFLFLILLAATVFVISRVNRSRLGRAWRAMREDELAAEVMGMPTRRLKLMAFAIGAGVAALSGAVYAAWQGNVVPSPRYSALTLITLYGMVILGGMGSIPGVIIGALIFTALPEILRNPALAGFLFYIGLFAALIIALKPWKRFAAIVGGTIAGGILLKILINAVAPDFASGVAPAEGSFINQWVQSWLVIPQDLQTLGNIAIGAAIVMTLITFRIRAPLRWVTLGISLYLLAFAWETRLAPEEAITRLLVLGGTLLVLMLVRPQGLLGKTSISIG